MRYLVLTTTAILLSSCSGEHDHGSTLNKSFVTGARQLEIKSDKPLFVWIDKSAADANAGLGVQPKDMAFDLDISSLDDYQLNCSVREKLTSLGFAQADCGMEKGRLTIVMRDAAGRRLSMILHDAPDGRIGGPAYIQAPGIDSKLIQFGKAQLH